MLCWHCRVKSVRVSLCPSLFPCHVSVHMCSNVLTSQSVRVHASERSLYLHVCVCVRVELETCCFKCSCLSHDMYDRWTDGRIFLLWCLRFLYLLSFISILMLALLRLLRATNNPLRSALTCCMRLDETTKALDRNTFGAKEKVLRVFAKASITSPYPHAN